MDYAAFQELRDKPAHLYSDHRYADALALVEQSAGGPAEASAHTMFWRMCLLSLCGRPDDVVAQFRQALERGLWWSERQLQDVDLDTVRDLPEFKRLVGESVHKCNEARRWIRPDRIVPLPDEPAHAMPLLIAPHGHSGNQDQTIQYWGAAQARGPLVLAPERSQVLYPGEPAGYGWDDSVPGMQDILLHCGEITSRHPIDRERVVIAGFSQRRVWHFTRREVEVCLPAVSSATTPHGGGRLTSWRVKGKICEGTLSLAEKTIPWIESVKSRVPCERKMFQLHKKFMPSSDMDSRLISGPLLTG